MSSLNRNKELTEVRFGNRDSLILKSIYHHYSWKKANVFLLKFDIFVKLVKNLIMDKTPTHALFYSTLY